MVVPIYNSSDCLPELVRQLTDQLTSMKRRYEIILVEDCSPDQSWQVIRNLVSQYPNLRAFQLTQNSGQAKATVCGLAEARGQFVFTMDDDLQHPPDHLPRLLEELERDPTVDCVFAIFLEKKHAGYRNLGSRVVAWVNSRAFGLPADFRTSSFRVMRSFVARAAVSHQTDNPAILRLILASTSRVKNRPGRRA